MKSKKKLILAISSFSFVLVTAIVAVVAIFAAQNQGVQTTFRISYTAKNVAASVRANYTVGATTTAMLTDSGEDELVFLPEMAEGTGKLSPETDNIALEDETSVVLEYIFSNDSDTVDVAISLDTSAFVLDNMRVSYAYSYSRITNYATMPTDDSFEPMMILGKTDENGDYDTLYVYMKVEVDNLANDASFTGSILYNLDRATPVKLDFGGISEAGTANELLLKPRYVPSGVNINDLPTPYFVNSDEYGYGYMGATWMDLEDDYALRLPLNITTNTILRAGDPYIVTPENKSVTLSVSFDATGNRYIKASNQIKYIYDEYEGVSYGDGYIIFNVAIPITILDMEHVSANKQITPLDLTKVGVTVVCTPIDLESEQKQYEMSADGKYLYFGEYPQSLKEDDVNIVSSTPDQKGYFLGDDGERYYLWNTKYFKVEPLKWRVLTQEDGKAFIMCDMAIDAVLFHQEDVLLDDGCYLKEVLDDGEKVCAADYEYSYLRQYLNNEFFNRAFGDREKNIVMQTLVQNDYDDTLDNVFILSEDELSNPEYGFMDDPWDRDENRYWYATDFTRSKGAYVYDEIDPDVFDPEEIIGTTMIWTRSIYGFDPSMNGYSQITFSECGYVIVDGAYGSDVQYMEHNAILPAMWIEL